MRKLLFVLFYIGICFHTNAQANQVETVVAFGTGANQADALYNAKINAMDQIFGTFISTKTVITNDSVAMSNVISITNGKITNYEIIKTDKTEFGYIITIKVSANLQNLVAFCNTIGIESYVQGSMFSDNLGTKLKNKENEIKVLNNFLETFKKEIPTIFDYTIKTNEPLKASNSENFLIKINCEFVLNKNYNSILNVLIDLINEIGIKESELPDYKRSNLEYFPILIQSNERTCYKFLRSKDAQKIVLNFVKLIEEYLQTHAIVRNDKKEFRPYSRIGDNFNFLYYLSDQSWESYKFFSTYIQPLSIGKFSYKCDKGDEQVLADAIIKKYTISSCIEITDSLLYSQKFEFDNKVNMETPFFILTSKCTSYTNSKISFTYNDWVTIDEMKRIEKYTIKR
ncbi:MAG: hypothetical protein ACO21S_05765 [Sediminibacterium sp.]